MTENSPVADYGLPFMVGTGGHCHQTFCLEPQAKSVSDRSSFQRDATLLRYLVAR